MLGELIVGTDIVGSTQQLFAIRPELRTRHAYILARQGQGKSTSLHRMIHQDAQSPHALVVFDAGDLATSLVETFDDRTLERVRFFSVDHPIPYNPLLRRLDEPGRLENELY